MSADIPPKPRTPDARPITRHSRPRRFPCWVWQTEGAYNGRWLIQPSRPTGPRPYGSSGYGCTHWHPMTADGKTPDHGLDLLDTLHHQVDAVLSTVIQIGKLGAAHHVVRPFARLDLLRLKVGLEQHPIGEGSSL